MNVYVVRIDLGHYEVEVEAPDEDAAMQTAVDEFLVDAIEVVGCSTFTVRESDAA